MSKTVIRIQNKKTKYGFCKGCNKVDLELVRFESNFGTETLCIKCYNERFISKKED